MGNGASTAVEIDLLVKTDARKWWDREKQASA